MATTACKAKAALTEGTNVRRNGLRKLVICRMDVRRVILISALVLTRTFDL